MVPSPDALFATPDHYLFAFDDNRAIFRAMDRAAYHRSIFLDRRISPARGIPFEAPLAPLLAWRRQQPAGPRSRIGWIFHIAHCGSTLLARALDLPERSLVLREPLALRQLGVQRVSGDPRLPLTAAFLGRRYQAEAPVIVKANVPVNFIATELLALDPEAPAVFLYFPLRTYLLAILRSEGHRSWVMNVTAQLPGAPTRADVVERAAWLWLSQMRLYDAALARFPGARSLHAESLFGAPREVLGAAAEHFGMDITAAEVDEIVNGPLFATYSKGPGQPFDNVRRLAQQAEAAARLGLEIERARRWVAQRPCPASLDKPLAGFSPDLLG
jgi:hypothetical protein